MGKRIIAINSSKRKRNTYRILQQLQEQLKERDIQVDIVNLFDYEIKTCVGCEVCLRYGNCKLEDQQQMLMDKLTTYDGIILSTPVYMGNVSGKLKVFIDRTCRWFHRPELIGIPMLSVATTSASGLKDTFSTLENVAIQWGAFPTNAISRKVTELDKKLNEKEYQSFLSHLYLSKESYKPSMKQIMHFQVQKVLAEKILIIDKKYWLEKQWLNKPYFYDTETSMIKKGAGSLFYKFLSGRVQKTSDSVILANDITIDKK